MLMPISRRGFINTVGTAGANAGGLSVTRNKRQAGKHDVAVDMCALMARVVDEASPQITVIKPQQPKRDRWDKAFDNDEGYNRKTS